MKSALASLLSTALVAVHAAALTVADADGAWLQLIPAGTFKGRDGQGPFVAGDRAAMQVIIDNTKKFAGSTDLVVDYDHQSVFAAIPGVGGRAPAAGWIKELQVRDDGIYGRVEWTEAASASIKAKEYRYLSPVFLHAKDGGRVLVIRMAALTNTPNLDLAEVAASALVNLNNSTGDSMDQILAALGLAKGSGEDAVLSAINALLTNSTAIAKALGLTDGAKPADILTAVNSAVADRSKFAQAAGLAADAKPDAIVTAVQSAMSGTVDPRKFVPIEQVVALQTEMKSLKDTVVGDKAEEAVMSAIKDGKLIPALKDWGLDLYKKDAAAFGTFVGSAPQLTASQLGDQKKRDANAPAALDDAQLAAIAVMGIDPEAYRKTLAAEEAQREAR